jgi:hypothetical protein
MFDELQEDAGLNPETTAEAAEAEVAEAEVAEAEAAE